MKKCNGCKYYRKGIECDNCEKEEVSYYQPKFRRWIDSRKWNNISERLENYVGVIGMVMSAEYDGDCSWVIWKQCDYILERIRQIAKEINRNLGKN